jgi:hypothetical protein
VRWAVYDQSIAIAAGFAVATALAFMQLTNTIHPPGTPLPLSLSLSSPLPSLIRLLNIFNTGGATALIAVTSAKMAWGGYRDVRFFIYYLFMFLHNIF